MALNPLDDEDRVPLPQWACSFKGWSMPVPDDGMFRQYLAHPERTITIKCASYSTTNWLTVLGKETTPFRKSLEIGETEIDQVDSGGLAFIVVGLTLHPNQFDFDSSLASADGPPKPAKGKGQSLGLGFEKPHESTIRRPSPEFCNGLPLIAVTRVRDSQEVGAGEKQTKYGVLIPSDQEVDKGRCIAYAIPGSKLCFLSQFRLIGKENPGASFAGRKRAWGDLVFSAAMAKNTIVDNKRQNAFARGREPTVPVMNIRVSMANEVRLLTQAFKISGKKWQLDRINSIIDLIEKDHTVNKPIESQIDLFLDQRDILEDTEGFEDEVAAKAAEEVHENWPKEAATHGIDKAIMVAFLTGMKTLAEQKEPHDIPHHLYKNLVVEFAFQLKNTRELPDTTSRKDQDAMEEDADANGMRKSDIARITREAIATTLRHGIGYQALESTRSIYTTNDLDAFLLATCNRLDEIIKAAVEFREGILGRAGDQTPNIMPGQVWQQYGRSMDIDEAKLAFMAGCRWFGAQAMSRDSECVSMLEALQKVLKNAVTNRDVKIQGPKGD